MNGKKQNKEKFLKDAFHIIKEGSKEILGRAPPNKKAEGPDGLKGRIN